MRSIAAKTIDNAIKKAQDLGIEEESFVVGDCEVILRNLRPDEYTAVDKEVENLEGREYANQFQRGQISRAIVEVNGVDLRDVDFVECEEPDPKDSTKTKTIRRERHDWVFRNVVSTWSSEIVWVAFRKFLDVVSVAEKKGSTGVRFIVPEETDEEKFRRLMGEAKEIEDNVPPLLVTKILEEHGYMLRSHLNTEKSDVAPDAAEAPPNPESQGHDLATALRTRIPLSQQSIMAPAASVSEPAPQKSSVPVKSVPPQVPQGPVPGPMPSAPSARVLDRTSQIAATLAEEPVGLEDQDLRASPPQAVTPPGVLGPAVLQPTPDEDYPARPVLQTRQVQPNPSEMQASIDRPPAGGMNPMFRRPR